MRVRALLSVTTLALLAACAGGGPASPPGLAYSLPDPPQLVYEQGDTMNMDIDAGGQSMQVTVNMASTLGASFVRSGDGFEVTLEVQDLAARLNNPVAGVVRADESGIDAPVVFTMDRRGRTTLVSAPELDETTEQFFSPITVASSMFPRVPGRAVEPGYMWTDTVNIDGQQGGGTVKSVSVLNYTVVGDTVVDGRSLLRFDFEGTVESASAGVTAGMDFTQNASGDASGYVLWDMQRSLVVEMFSEGDMRGSMEVAAAPFPLGMRMRAQSRMKLKDGM